MQVTLANKYIQDLTVDYTHLLSKIDVPSLDSNSFRSSAAIESALRQMGIIRLMSALAPARIDHFSEYWESAGCSEALNKLYSRCQDSGQGRQLSEHADLSALPRSIVKDGTNPTATSALWHVPCMHRYSSLFVWLVRDLQ